MTRRGPALLLIVALVAAGLALDHRDPVRGDRPPIVDPARLAVVATPDDALGSVWFCAGQSASADGPADGTVVIANHGTEPATGEIQVVSVAGERAAEDLAVAAHTTVRMRVGDVLDADWAAVRVDLSGGTVTVEHEVSGPRGRDAAPCQTRAGTAWSFPSGGTTRDARLLLAVYNPYPDAATVDLALTTESEVRRPRAFQGVPVAAGSVVVVDVGEVVTVSPVVAISVGTRRGRVVVDRIQTYDGRGAATTDEEAEAEPYQRAGLTLTPGVPAARTAWSFPVGERSLEAHERVVVFNPGETDAEVEVTVALFEPERNGVLDPLSLVVPSGATATLDVDQVLAVPDGIAHALDVRSANGVPILAERWIDRVPVAGEEPPPPGGEESEGDEPGSEGEPAEGDEETGEEAAEEETAGGEDGEQDEAGADDRDVEDIATSTGSPVAGPRWAFAAGPPDDERATARLAVVNRGRTPVTVDVAAFGDGTLSPLDGGTGVEVAPGALLVVDLSGLAPGRTSLLVTASGPIVAERRWATSVALGVALPAGLAALPPLPS